ncbi:MAG: benzoate-CoA ligase family protein [SAR324 cluster bacterium]|nr:benzoate-CoA ligase family protein [SAR324 cluster bacterium]
MHEIPLPGRFNIAEYFIRPNLEAGRADKPYLICDEECLTYGELDSRANRMGHALRRLGVEPENRVLLVLPDSLQFPVCFWGAVRIGAVAVPVNTMWQADDYRHCLEDSRAKVVVVDAEFWPKLAPALAGLRRPPLVILAGDRPTPADQDDSHPWLEDLLAGETEAPATEYLSPEHPALWLYTSGSTGPPKAAVHAHGNMVYPAVLLAGDLLGLGPDDLTFSASKFFFAYGLGNSLYFPMAAGATAVIRRERPTPEGILATLARHRPTVLYAVPTLYNALINTYEEWLAGEHTPSTLPDFSRLRLAVSAGEPLPAEIYHRWRRHFGCDLLDGIGSTEMLHTFIANPPGESRPGSTGKIVAGYEARLVDEDCRDVPLGEPGTLWVAGGSAAPRYWNRRAKTRGTMIGPWMVTGDRFRCDVDGYYWCEGRTDDMIKVGGVWVSPMEVEGALLTHPAVAECAVVGHDNEAGLTRAKAFVVVKFGHTAGDDLAHRLIAHTAELLPPFKTPQWVAFAAELPKTSTGKIQRFVLRK